MPKDGISLTAKYYASYSVKVYLEALAGGYGEPSEETGTAFYGEAFTYEPAARAHYTVSEEAEGARLSTDSLQKNESFSVYYDLERYTVAYYPNAPEDVEAEGTIPAVGLKYGESTEIAENAYDLGSPLYRFGGWATEDDGAPVYKAGDTVSPESNLSLYAVWDKAYTDRFGGGDLLFTPKGEEGAVILMRAGEEHRGALSGETFTFGDAESPILKGKLGPDGTFVYYRDAQRGVTYAHLDAYTETLHEDGATLTFDGEGGATYSEGTMSESGTLVYDPETFTYTFVYADGKAFEFSLATYTDGEEEHDVFLRRGAEYGIYFGYDFHYTEEGVSATYGFSLYLDGFGIAAGLDTAAMLEENAVELLLIGTYTPISESEVSLELYDADDDVHTYRAKLLSYNGYDIWVQYFADYAQEFTAEDGAKLTLNGYSGTYDSAVYAPASGASKEGMYVVEFSPLGYAVRLVEEGGDVTTFRISPSEKAFSVLGGGDYAEYLCYVGDSGYVPVDAPVLVFGEDNTATLSDGKTVTEGTVSAVEGKEGRFRFTSEKTTFEYELGGEYFSVMGQVYYFRYYVPYVVATESTKVLSEADGEGELLLEDFASGYGNARYTDGAGIEHAGAYALMSGEDFMLTFDIIEFANFETGVHTYFRLGEDKEGNYTSFALLGAESGTYYLYDGYSLNSSVMLMLMGSDDEKVAMYMDMDSYAMGTGTYTYDDETGTGTVSYSDLLSGSEETFSFMLLEAGGELCFARHTDLFKGTLEATSGEHTLSLDGYGFASYDGLEAQYVLVGGFGEAGKGNVYRFYLFGTAEEGMFEGYFDIDLVKKTYTACGYEVGQYYADDGSGDVLALDGYGVVTRYNLANSDGDNLTPLETGEYHFTDAEEEVVLVTFEEESYLIHIYATSDGEDTTNYYTKAYGGAGTYRSEAWELLTLAPYGDAYYTDVYGITYEGTYSALTAHTVVFSSDGTDELIAVLGEKFTFTAPTSGFVVDGDVLVKYLGGEGKDLRIPDGVKEIAPLAFSVHEYGSRYRGADIETLDLNEVEIIGENAFNGCAQLLSVTGNEVLEIGESAFYACIELKELALPKLERVGEFAFHLCESLEDVEFASLKAIASSAFSECHTLETVSLPAIETLEEGVFYDCFMLKTVTLGASLTRIGTPEDPVAGVFERSYSAEQAPLTLILEGSTPPAVGEALFDGVTYYTVKVPTMSALKAFYADGSWAEYSLNIGVADTPRLFYYYNSGAVWTLELDGTAKINRGSATSYGAYEIKDGHLYVYKSGLAEPQMFGDVDETAHTVLVDIYGYGEEYKSDYWYSFYEAGYALKLSIMYAENEEDSLTFTPVKADFYAGSTIFEVDGELVENGVKKDVKIVLSKDMYGDTTLYMVDGKYRRSMSVYFSSKSVSLGDPAFIPVVTTYEAADTSYLALSQNNEAGTAYTASFVIASIRDDLNEPLSVSQVAVEKQADGKTYKVKDPVISGSYSYIFTFTVDETAGTFTYTMEAQRRTAIQSDDGSFQVIIFQNADGSIASVTAYVAYSDYYGTHYEMLDGKTEAFLYTHADGSMTYEWLIYDYNYAGHYILTLTGSGDTLDGTIASEGTVAKGYYYGVYAVAFYEEEQLAKLYMLGKDDEVYFEVPESEIAQKEGYLEVTHGESKYYLTVSDSGSIKIVVGTVVYQSEAFEGSGAVAGTATVTYTHTGSISSVVITIDGKTYSEYSMVSGKYLYEIDGEYYLTELFDSSCDILKLQTVKATYEKTQFELEVLIQKNYTYVKTLSLKVAGAEVKDAKYKSTLIGGKDHLEVTVGETVYLVNLIDGSVELLEEVTVTTKDGTYRLTLPVAGSMFLKCIKFEKFTDGEFVEQTADWSGPRDGEEEGKPYNYEVDIGSTYYYFEISEQDGTWTAELVKTVEW